MKAGRVGSKVNSPPSHPQHDIADVRSLLLHFVGGDDVGERERGGDARRQRARLEHGVDVARGGILCRLRHDVDEHHAHGRVHEHQRAEGNGGRAARRRGVGRDGAGRLEDPGRQLRVGGEIDVDDAIDALAAVEREDPCRDVLGPVVDGRVGAVGARGGGLRVGADGGPGDRVRQRGVRRGRQGVSGEEEGGVSDVKGGGLVLCATIE